MKTTKETLTGLIIQYKSEMLIGDDLVQALEDFRDMWEGVDKAIDTVYEYLPSLKDNQ